jgi:hypothetical protein
MLRAAITTGRKTVITLCSSTNATTPALLAYFGDLHTINGRFKGVSGRHATTQSVMGEETSATRRAAFQAGWDARLLPLLTTEWQSSVALAKALGEKPATVLERLKDMLDRELVERRVVKAVPSKPTKTGKRPRIHTARFEAHFRLPQQP